MMSDDIDIEEHDVLDNPRIKNIFPDIASIKTEVIDYEEETPQQDYEEDDIINYENYEYLNEFTPVDNEFEAEPSNVYQNKIILGSKPCSSPIHSDDEVLPSIQECSVILEDWSPILDNSPYCKECQTLFPTQNALDSHKMTAHSFLIVVSNNKAVKSTSKSPISPINFSSDEEVICKHCNVTFPNENALLRHSYELLPSNFNINNQVDCIENVKDSPKTYFSCYICSCVFKGTGHLFFHLQRLHGVKKENMPLKTVTTLKCQFCPSHLVSAKTYNVHIYKSHFEIYTLKEMAANQSPANNYSCDLCDKVFITATSLIIHVAIKHEVGVTVEKPKSVPKHKNDASTLMGYRRPIPICTLFSCNKCQIHFVSCLVAVEHSKRCNLTKGDWKCNKCLRSFKMADKQPHLRQHELSLQGLKVIKIRSRILDRVLCRCMSCNICFDEQNLFKYHSCSCSQSKSIFCSICQVGIHEHAKKKHMRLHNEFPQKQHFIVVNYIFYDGTMKVATDLVSEVVVRKKRKYISNFLYYCPSCKLYMKVTCNKHMTGKCNKTGKKCLCMLCGLRFSKKCYKSHQETHRRIPNIKLKDIKFQNIQTGEKIDPPYPLFKKCQKCKVCFFTSVGLKNHLCYGKEVKVCEYCSEKFSDVAYKLHVPFHEYRNEKKLDAHIPELMKKYESLKTVWNILFLCKTCDVVFDAYDEVVEHCQDHYCNMENYNVIINHCEICDLNIRGRSFDRHENLHLANDINKSSFTIINFNFETLLSDSWLDIFDALAPEQVDQILQKSIYKETRSVRMSVLVDKNTDLVLYKCGMCKMIVDNSSITQHAQNRNNCVIIMKYSCSICNFKFYNNKSLLCHQEIHKNLQIDEDSFKIISFNNEKDEYVNKSLQSVSNPEPLKFIRCQHCGKLIIKSKYTKHISCHKNLERKKIKKVQPKIARRKRNFQSFIKTFYRCQKCEVCVFKQNIKVHLCSNIKGKKQCPYCNLWFTKSHMQKHIMAHKKYKFSNKHVKVINFRDGEEEEETDVKKEENEEEEHSDLSKVILHQCAVCNTCLHNKNNIIKHKCIDERLHTYCNLCEVPIPSSHYHFHQGIHEQRTFSKMNVVIMKFNKKLVIPSKFKDYTAAKLLTRKPTDLPRQLKQKDETIDEASESSSQILVNDNEVNCEIAINGFLKRISHRYFLCNKCYVCFVTGSALAEHVKYCADGVKKVTCECGLTFRDDDVDIHKKKQKCSSKPMKLYIVTLTDNTGDFNLNKCLYKCKKCDIYYLTLNTALGHFEEGHNTVSEQTKCNECNIWFSSISNTKHNKIHHKQNKWTKSDLFYFEIETMTKAEVLQLSLNQAVPSKLSNESTTENKAIKRKIVAEPSTRKKVVREPEIGLIGANQSPCSSEIYTCEVCHLNFVNAATLKTHLQVGNHKKNNTANCEKCGLQFTLRSLASHLRWKKRKTNETDDISINNTLDESQSSDMVSLMENMSKLFKCGECDVYFVTLEVCNDHMIDHQVLDPTEYIACKVCELQFLCENLGVHMKSHRNNTFNMEELVVKEFHPNKDTVDTYLALDRLKSKAVSTTTHFDTNDDKTVTVDSTNMDS